MNYVWRVVVLLSGMTQNTTTDSADPALTPKLASIDDIILICGRAPQPESFMGSVFRNCESEVMMWQTLHACLINHSKGYGVFSLKGDWEDAPMRGVNNTRGYNKLLNGKYVIEGQFEGKTTIIPTQLLIDEAKRLLKL